MSYIYLIIMVALTSSAQYFVKKGSATLILSNGLLSFLKSFFTKPILIGGTLTLMAPIFYILALRTLPLSTAYIFSSLNVAIITMIGHFVFKEHLPWSQILGVLLIISGILCFAL